METIGVGMVGAGFAATVHASVLQGLGGRGARLAAVMSRSQDSADALAQRFGIPHATTNLDALLQLDEIDVVDLCVPNQLHHQYALQALAAGKHVIVEKPLTGYFGQGETDVGCTAKKEMLAAALQSADEMVAAAKEAGVQLMYAENWLYAPAFQKAKRLIRASQGTIFELRGEESHHGSHSRAARRWATSGGGALIRLGSHPLGAILHLKQCEGIWRTGEPIRPVSVVADVANLTQVDSFRAEETKWVVDDWEDVENWSQIIMTFSDGSKATVAANDVCLGGMRDTLDIYLSNSRLHCNLTHSNALEAYAPAPEIFEAEYLMEKLETKAGWSFPSLSEELLLGYHDELLDFVQAIQEEREPLSTGDLGRAVVHVIYAAYVAAEEQRAVRLDEAQALS